MKMSTRNSLLFIWIIVVTCVPVSATVAVVSITPSLAPPQPVGTQVIWTVTATDTNPGPLTFQFNVSYGGGPFALVRDFNVGTANTGTWTSQPFAWAPTDGEGTHQIQVVVKDFASSETASSTIPFRVTSLVSGGNPVVVPTANPLVALFSAPACPAGSFMRVVFQQQSKATPATVTNWLACHPPVSMTFEVAGMYPGTPYTMRSQTATGSQTTNGAIVNFTTGTLASVVKSIPFTVNVPAGPQTDTTDAMILHGLVPGGTSDLNIATDLGGRVKWYYLGSDSAHTAFLTRPLKNTHLLTFEDGASWNPASHQSQFLREVDLAGNIVRETNVGILQQQLFQRGAVDAKLCSAIASPTPVGSACLGAFHHDAIRLPNGFTAVLMDIEKIFPPGTHGDTSGLPVDVIGDMIVVLNTNWQVSWYFDTFDHDGGGHQLDITRAAVLDETCVDGDIACPPLFLLGTGVAPRAYDWLHANSLYYTPINGDFLLSCRDQDWVLRIDYKDGSGTGNILWRLGIGGDFSLINVSNDAFPWFSHQHDVGVENAGAGPLTVFDNGNTRVAAPPVGLGSGNSRGMAFTVDEKNMRVTPVFSADLGTFSFGLGSAQLLSNGNYFFQPGAPASLAIELFPTPGTITGTQVSNVQSFASYRAWRMPNLYNPPDT